MRTITTLMLLCLLTVGLKAQDNSFAKANIQIWENAKNRTIATAQAMPEDKYSYRPVDGVMTFGQQMAHIANSMRSMETRFLKGQSWNQNEPNAANMSKSEIIEFLKESFDATISTINALSEDDLTKPGKNFGNPRLNKEQSMLFMFDHITNHRAKTVLYLRLNGIRPPAYGFN